VEDTLATAIERVTGAACALSVAGRTDAGVHAWGQVASFPLDDGDGDPGRLARSLNGVLPRDVAAVGAECAPEGFDARRDARSRTYCYRVLARAAPSPLECARLLLGTHDFTAFTPRQTDHVRLEREVFEARWARAGEILELWIEADAFMRHMVRVLVGTMLEVASGRRSASEFAKLLEGAPRSAAGETVEAHGLYLASVAYRD
jgi:tRNA pseudouridine38-40 synthase